jgi:hypothetical protein
VIAGDRDERVVAGPAACEAARTLEADHVVPVAAFRHVVAMRVGDAVVARAA